MIILAAAPHQCISAEGLNIGPLSSLDLKTPSLEYSPDPQQGLATLPVRLLLSDLIYWPEQLEMLLTMSTKSSSSGLDFLTVGDFGALHWPMSTLPPLAPKIVSSEEKNLFRTSLFCTAGQKVSPLAGS